MPTIERILKWGSGEWQTLMLSCGHKRKVRRQEVKADQLMPGKRVACAECEERGLPVAAGSDPILGSIEAAEKVRSIETKRRKS